MPLFRATRNRRPCPSLCRPPQDVLKKGFTTPKRSAPAGTPGLWMQWSCQNKFPAPSRAWRQCSQTHISPLPETLLGVRLGRGKVRTQKRQNPDRLPSLFPQMTGVFLGEAKTFCTVHIRSKIILKLVQRPTAPRGLPAGIAAFLVQTDAVPVKTAPGARQEGTTVHRWTLLHRDTHQSKKPLCPEGTLTRKSILEAAPEGCRSWTPPEACRINGAEHCITVTKQVHRVQFLFLFRGLAGRCSAVPPLERRIRTKPLASQEACKQ